jgi:hypothetical protein
MKVTLCGSAKYEKEFREWDRVLTLAGHTVYNLAVYPSEMGGKDWYTPKQKAVLDAVHRAKIDNSDCILVLNVDGYIGESTSREIVYATQHGKSIRYAYRRAEFDGRICPYRGCLDPLSMLPPCALCYGIA